jgi:hypothetical protein
LKELHGGISGVFKDLLGEHDDISPQEMRAVLVRLDRSTSLKAVRTKLQSLRKPRLNATDQDSNKMKPKLCLFGARFTPDARLLFDAMDSVGRASGVQVMAGLGSPAALAEIGEGEAARLERAFSGFRSAFTGNLYEKTFALLAGQVGTPDERAPAYAKTHAWGKRCLYSGLAQWASVKHAWQLQAKNPFYCTFGGLGGGKQIPVVEPNPAYFEKLGKVIESLKAILEHYQIGTFQKARDLPLLKRFLSYRTQSEESRKNDGLLWNEYYQKCKKKWDFQQEHDARLLIYQTIEKRYNLEPGDFEAFESRRLWETNKWLITEVVKLLESGKDLSPRLRKKLDKVIGLKALRKLGKLKKECRFLSACAERQLEGKVIEQGEIGRLQAWGRKLRWLEKETNVTRDFPDDNPIVADVLDVTGACPPTPLCVATGRPREILVLVESQGVKYVCRGGVMTYYEWWEKDGQRLTDAAWRKRLQQEKRPPPPAFTREFMSLRSKGKPGPQLGGTAKKN